MYSAVQCSSVQVGAVQSSAVILHHCNFIVAQRAVFSWHRYLGGKGSPTSSFAVQFSSLQYSIVQLIAVQYSSAHYCTVQCSSLQYSTVQLIAVQYSAAQCISVECRPMQWRQRVTPRLFLKSSAHLPLLQ